MVRYAITVALVGALAGCSDEGGGTSGESVTGSGVAAQGATGPQGVTGPQGETRMGRKVAVQPQLG